VRIFELVGTVWTLRGQILGRAAYDRFGASVSISGSGHRVIAGMQSQNPAGTNGYVRVYDFLVPQVLDLDGTVAGSEHGYAVDMDATGDRVVVTNPGLAGENGGFSIYDYNSVSSPPQWDRNFVRDEGGWAARFGHSVSMSPDGLKVLVGAPKYSGGDYRGYFRVFRFDSITSWIEDYSGENLDGSYSYLGVTVDITDGKRIVLGMPGQSGGTTGKVRRITNKNISQ
jgi:hypothetical protein